MPPIIILKLPVFSSSCHPVFNCFDHDQYYSSNGDWAEAYNLSMGSNPYYNTNKPGEKEIEIMKLMIIFQMTYVGAPYIYYGDEAGMWGANDPSCRKPMVWDDLKYENEVYLPDQHKKSKPDTVVFNNELFEFYKKLIAIRNSNPVLQLGNYKTLLIDNRNRIYAYERNLDSTEIIIILNNGNTFQTVSLPLNQGDFYKDLLNGDTIPVEDGKITFNLESKQGKVLLMDY